MANAFLDSTVVEPQGDGAYRGHIDEIWNLRPRLVAYATWLFLFTFLD